MNKYLYIVETSSVFKITYAVTTEKELKNGRLQHIINEGKLNEMSQEFLGENIVGVVPLNKEQFINKVETIYPEAAESPEEVKLSMINDIDGEVIEMLGEDEI